jgi:hypothetical protein
VLVSHLGSVHEEMDYQELIFWKQQMQFEVGEEYHLLTASKLTVRVVEV